MTLRETMAALAAGGVVLGGIMSFLFERFEWFQKLSSKARFWTIGGLSIGLPVAAVALNQYVPAEWWAWLEPFWQAAFAGGASWLGGQFVHRYINRGQ